MVRFNNDDQFKFLISCIRYSNNGKVDFIEVAKECDIVSKGAAAKRYERMMKAHGIYQGGPTRETSKGEKVDKGDVATPKKRKADKLDTSNASDTEEATPKKKVKNEPSTPRKANKKVKKEYSSSDNDNYSFNFNANTASPSLDDEAFSEFLNSAAFEPINGPSRFNGVQSGVEDISPRGGDFLSANAGQFLAAADENQSSIIIDE